MTTAHDHDKKTSVISLTAIQGKKESYLRRLLVINVAILMINIGAGVAIVSKVTNSNPQVALNSYAKDSTNSPKTGSTQITKQEVKKENVNMNPFNGIILTDEQWKNMENRPLAVMMDNSKPAQPVQENINKADIVYESLTEYGITRFMGIYYSDQSNFRVMPIRSIRRVFLDNLREYNDILLYHVGGAFTPDEPKTNAVQKIFDEKIKSIYFYKHAHSPTFNELYDGECTKKGVPGYSCKYHFVHTLWKKATDVGYQSEKWEPERKFEWKWKFDDSNFTKSENIAINIKYKFAYAVGYDADWTYDQVTKRYLRKTSGKPHMDNAAKEQVWTNTLIVEKIPFKLDIDDKKRSIATTIGEGEAYIFIEGKVTEVKWKKDCETCRTRYYNKTNGDEFVFKPGRMWVSVTRDVEPVSYGEGKATTPTPTTKNTTTR